MAQDSSPFSPFLLVGMALQPLPIALVERIAAPLLRTAARKLEPSVADRLAGLYGRIAVIPAELPFGIVFTVGSGLEIDLIEKSESIEAEATIRAPVQVLLDLATGTGLDGDGSFFSRELVMEGDTGLCMAFRYALEDSGLSPTDMIAETFRLPKPLLFQAEDLAARLHKAARIDADRFQSSLLSPVLSRVSRLERELGSLREELKEMTARNRRRAGV